MAAILRFCSRRTCNSFLNQDRINMLSLARSVTLKPQAAQPTPNIGHDELNMKLGRPQSPHLTIYAPQLTSMLSISHRATGMVLAGYTIMFGAAAILLPDSIPNYLDALESRQIGSFFLLVAKLALAFPLSYHFWNGVRHLFWDMGMFLNLKEVYLTGYVMLALAVVSTIALCSM